MALTLQQSSEYVRRHSILCFGRRVVRSEALGMCFEMYHALFAACFVFLSSLYRQWWREWMVEQIDKWGQEERSLRRVSLSCSEFNINTGWKDSSSLHHPNTAERHNDISIRKERGRKKRQRGRVRVSVRERVDCHDKSVSNKTLNFISLRQLPWRSSMDSKWAGFKSSPIQK